MRAQMLNLIALPALLLATLAGHDWPWGLLFLFWAIGSWRTGEAHLVQSARRRTAPRAFWAVLGLWLGAGLALIARDGLWRIGVTTILGLEVSGG